MAARKRNWQTNKTREKIRDTINTKKIVARLEAHVLCEDPDKEIKDLNTGETKKVGKMTATQIKAAQVLLDRTMPVLSSAEITEITEDHDPKALLAALAKVLPQEMVDTLRAKFMPTEHTAPETLQ